jgi:hypothetical protein
MNIFLNFVAFIILIVFFGLIGDWQNKRELEEKQRKEQEKKEMEQKRKEDIEMVKQFAKNNNSNIDDLLKIRDELYASAVRAYVSGVLSQPMIPTKVTPVYRGNAPAEYVANKMNAERQATYNNLLSSSQSMIGKSKGYQRQYQMQENLIFEKLKSIPESEEYIEILQQYFLEDKKIFEK